MSNSLVDAAIDELTATVGKLETRLARLEYTVELQRKAIWAIQIMLLKGLDNLSKQEMVAIMDVMLLLSHDG